jgi:hypothetical protein
MRFVFLLLLREIDVSSVGLRVGLELAVIIVLMSIGSSGGLEALLSSEAEEPMGSTSGSLFESLPFFQCKLFVSVASIKIVLSDWVLSKFRLLTLLFPKAF